jgi:hypothetical protein
MGSQYPDYDNIRDATHGLYSALDADDKYKLNQLWTGIVPYWKETEDVALLSEIQEHTMLRHDKTIRVTGGCFVCYETGTTANNGDYATFQLAWRHGTTGVQTIITNHATVVANGNIVQWRPYVFSLTAPSSSWVVPAGSTVTFSLTKQGLGVIVGKGLIQITYELVS